LLRVSVASERLCGQLFAIQLPTVSGTGIWEMTVTTGPFNGTHLPHLSLLISGTPIAIISSFIVEDG
jgi:hypothetical protein